ncbi:MAG: putative photosynthetic complex assembly protein PuhB [Pseudomonadota bacterium]|jgi:hypothetical protein
MRAHHNGHEHELEPQYGLPELLPADEQIVWQGSPVATEVFQTVFHGRALIAYFLAMVALRMVLSAGSGEGGGATAAAAAGMAAVFGLALAGFWLMAWLTAKTTVYTVTSKRLILRIGIVLNVTFNVPWSRIASADLRIRKHGAGDIAFRLVPEDKIAYLHLWPHARPWHFSHPEPMLRGLADVRQVSEVILRTVPLSQPIRHETDLQTAR